MISSLLRSVFQKVRGAAGGISPGSADPQNRAPYSMVTARRRIVAPTDYLCAITDIGRVRDRNEDAFHLSADDRVFIVADGMGGHDAGDVASALAIEAVSERLAAKRQQQGNAAGYSIEQLLLTALEAAQEKVLEAGQQHDSGREMGCTLVLALVKGDQLHTCHVGDVRCYVQSDGRLMQITKDHSVVGALVEEGQLTAEEARLHSRKNEVLQAIGMPHGIVPDVNSRSLRDGDRVLLCSDGLWEMLSDGNMGSVIASDGTMRQLATQLVDRAIRAGGYDNITAVLYQHRAEGSGSHELA